MSSLAICSCCGRTIDSSFVFCPWCGKSKVSGGDSTSAEALYESLRDKKHYEQEQRIANIGNRLDNLERELSVLVLSAEMHR